jgi:hypothetical protein
VTELGDFSAKFQAAGTLAKSLRGGFCVIGNPLNIPSTDNCLFDTEKVTHSFLGPRKYFLPYLTLS